MPLPPFFRSAEHPPSDQCSRPLHPNPKNDIFAHYKNYIYPSGSVSVSAGSPCSLRLQRRLLVCSQFSFASLTISLCIHSIRFHRRPQPKCNWVKYNLDSFPLETRPCIRAIIAAAAGIVQIKTRLLFAARVGAAKKQYHLLY